MAEPAGGGTKADPLSGAAAFRRFFSRLLGLGGVGVNLLGGELRRGDKLLDPEVCERFQVVAAAGYLAEIGVQLYGLYMLALFRL